MLLTKRASGILLHPTSLPGPYGAGDFGPDAYRFVDWLASAEQTYWQVLPLGEVGPGNSPYMSSSAFGGNILLIDLAELASQGWLLEEELKSHPDFRTERIDFPLQRPFRMELLHRAARRFFANPKLGKGEISNLDSSNAAYAAFCLQEREWLDDYALFMTLKETMGDRVWCDWPAGLATRNSKALRLAEKVFAAEISFWKFCQWCFARQWMKLKRYANSHGVYIIGDVPIFVAYQSADVWSHPELFALDQAGRPTFVAGVPPDYFSNTGQLWGNPLYRWDVHDQTGYAWWIARMRHALKLFDLVRIDHFRGFASYWEIPADAATAVHGKWVPGPGAKLFDALLAALGDLPIIAEDLGLITPDVVELRDRFNLPGMRILQFAFGEDETHHFLPHHYVSNSVAYTGTHDNDTSRGWWESATPKEKSFAQKYLGSNGQQIQWDMIKSIFNSEANTVIVPMQDVIGLAGEHRMNFPGQPGGNWEWRFSWSDISLEHTELLTNMTSSSGRYSSASTPEVAE